MRYITNKLVWTSKMDKKNLKYKSRLPKCNKFEGMPWEGSPENMIQYRCNVVVFSDILQRSSDVNADR